MSHRKTERKRIERNRQRRRTRWMSMRIGRANPEYLLPSGLYFGRDGQPISLVRWMREFDNRVVIATHVGHVVVSTIWTGTWEGSNPPAIFESAILWNDERGTQVQQRYATEAEARAPHNPGGVRTMSNMTAVESIATWFLLGGTAVGWIVCVTLLYMRARR